MKRKVVVWFRRIGLGVLLVLLLLICVMHGYIRYGIVEMPGNPYAGTPPPPNAMIRATTARLRTHVEVLANEIGGRSIYNTEALDRTQAWIAAEFRRLDLEPNKQTYEVEPELVNEAIERKRPVNCPMDRGMREDPGSVRVQEAASGSPVRVGFQFAGASSAISVMFMSGNLLRTSVR